MRASLWIGLALLTAACEDGAPEQNVTRVEAANPFSDQLRKMSDLYRNLGVKRAIADNGRRCKRVDRSGYQQQYKSMAMWSAHCTDTGDWALYIAPNGDVQVSPCGDAKTLGLPECRPAPPPSSSPHLSPATAPAASTGAKKAAPAR